MIKSTLSIAAVLTLTACNGGGSTSDSAPLDDTSSEPVPIVSTVEPVIPVADPVEPLAPTVEPVVVVTPADPTPVQVEPVVVTPEPESEQFVPMPEALSNLITNNDGFWLCSGNNNEVWTFYIRADGDGSWGAFNGGDSFDRLAWVVEADTLVLTSGTRADFALTGIQDAPQGFNGLTPNGIEVGCVKTSVAEITGTDEFPEPEPDTSTGTGTETSPPVTVVAPEPVVIDYPDGGPDASSRPDPVRPDAFDSLASASWRESWNCSYDATPDVNTWQFDLQGDNTGNVVGTGADLFWITEVDTLTVSGAFDFSLTGVRDSLDIFDELGYRVSQRGFNGYTPEGKAVTCAKQGETFTQPLTEAILITGPVGHWSCHKAEEPYNDRSSYAYQYFTDGTGTSLFTGGYNGFTQTNIPASTSPPVAFSWSFDPDADTIMGVALPAGLEYLTVIGTDVAGEISSYATVNDRYAPSVSCTKYRS